MLLKNVNWEQIIGETSCNSELKNFVEFFQAIDLACEKQSDQGIDSYLQYGSMKNIINRLICHVCDHLYKRKFAEVNTSNFQFLGQNKEETFSSDVI